MICWRWDGSSQVQSTLETLEIRQDIPESADVIPYITVGTAALPGSWRAIKQGFHAPFDRASCFVESPRGPMSFRSNAIDACDTWSHKRMMCSKTISDKTKDVEETTFPRRRIL
jgi:hypothetical protein